MLPSAVLPPSLLMFYRRKILYLQHSFSEYCQTQEKWLVTVNQSGPVLFVFRLTGIFVRYEFEPRKRKPFVLMSCVQSRTEAFQIFVICHGEIFFRDYSGVAVFALTVFSQVPELLSETLRIVVMTRSIIRNTSSIFVLCATLLSKIFL